MAVKGKLYRSQTDRKLGGVCGGLGPHLGVDVNLLRVIFVVLAFFNGIGLFIYLLFWILVPTEGQGEVGSSETVQSGAEEIAERARSVADEVRTAVRSPDPQMARLVGVILIILGGFFLLQTMGFFWWRWLRFDVLWPLLLVAAGVVLLWRRGKGE